MNIGAVSPHPAAHNEVFNENAGSDSDVSAMGSDLPFDGEPCKLDGGTSDGTGAEHPIDCGGNGELDWCESDAVDVDKSKLLGTLESEETGADLDRQAPVPTGTLLTFPALVPRKQVPSVSALESTQAPSQASVPGIGAQAQVIKLEKRELGAESKVPIHELDIIGWNSVSSGHGRSIRFKLGAPAPDTGCLTRYYTWVPEDQYDAWKKQFSIKGAINASRNKARIRAALRKRTG